NPLANSKPNAISRARPRNRNAPGAMGSPIFRASAWTLKPTYSNPRRTGTPNRTAGTQPRRFAAPWDWLTESGVFPGEASNMICHRDHERSDRGESCASLTGPVERVDSLRDGFVKVVTSARASDGLVALQALGPVEGGRPERTLSLSLREHPVGLFIAHDGCQKGD